MQNFAVLTASAGVSDALAGQVAARLRAQPRRLSPNAVEIPFDGPAPQIDLGGAPVDLNIVPASGRQKAMLIADMDSTIIPVECIDELADFAGVKPQVAEITERAMQGELDFEAAIDARVGLLAGLPVSALQGCYDSRVSLNPGAADLVGHMNKAGAMTALVSGGFTFFTERVASAAGFRFNNANRLEVADDTLTGKVLRPILGRAAKAEALQALCAERGITPDQVIAVGDGANDLDMIEMAGLGVAFHAKPALRAAADAVLEHSDLTALLALQGFSA